MVHRKYGGKATESIAILSANRTSVLNSNDIISPRSDIEYGIENPRTREHKSYKICQRNYGRADRRWKYGDQVDAYGYNASPKQSDNRDSQEQQLANAREARQLALRYDFHPIAGCSIDKVADNILLIREADKRDRFSTKYCGGAHSGVAEQAAMRRTEVENKWNQEIEALE